MSGLKDLETIKQNDNILVLVVGIHGVGKSLLIHKLQKEFPESYCTSASKLLSWNSPHKNVSNVTANQTVLTAMIQELKQQHSFIILDGHLCILDTKNEYVFVGRDIIESISPSMIVSVTADPLTVYNRLLSRDGVKSISLEKIQEGLRIEQKWANYISSELHIPLYIWESR